MATCATSSKHHNVRLRCSTCQSFSSCHLDKNFRVIAFTTDEELDSGAVAMHASIERCSGQKPDSFI